MGAEGELHRGCLRPDPEVLGREWAALVAAEYEQTERVREWQEADYYRPIVEHFVEDPYREGDTMLNALRAACDPALTWLDIGAGGGRNALPLALLSKRIIAVEPSPAMRDALAGAMEEHGIGNVDILPVRWPEGADGIEADLSLAAHVGYDVREINPFLDAMERATRRRCFALMMDRAPSSGYERLWPAIHGEERTTLPGMRELLHLLLARGALPEVRLFRRDVAPPDEEHIRRDARRRLWVQEGSPKDQQLQRILDAELAAGQREFGLPWVVALISWEPVRR